VIELGLQRAKINITGRVQGVGFRPFIYRIAVRHGLKGYVINLGDAGVEVVVEGDAQNIEAFIRSIREEAPPVSEVEEIHVKRGEATGEFKEFIIDKSRRGTSVASGIYPPDIGICDQCLADMERPGSRWYQYPFTACAWCGPRFTAVEALPYDRERTHMREFPMCASCRRDYLDPLDRRFDAQGITCRFCGPKMSLYDQHGNPIHTQNPIEEAANLITQGSIVAVKGIGGIHIACLATDDQVLGELRKRKHRDQQPFALMSPSLKSVKSFAEVSEAEEHWLTSWRKPIVVLRLKGEGLSSLVAPGLNTVGVMLPYTGIQTLLLKHIDEPAVVMTSGNKRGLPMAIDNPTAFRELKDLVDYFLLHNRRIVNRADDSVLRVINGAPAMIRRSRGFVPDPIKLSQGKGVVLALGAELRNAAAVGVDRRVYPTQYLGDVDSLETLEFQEKAMNRLFKLLNITRNPDVIACDLHPGYMTSRLAREISQKQDIPVLEIQHHFAHIASVKAEHHIEGEAIGIALDGAGFGVDGNIWGGEFLLTSSTGFKRIGRLENLPFPGGDRNTYFPYRMLILALSKTLTEQELRDVTKNHTSTALEYGETELETLLNSLSKGNYKQTSSLGRVLDSIAALTGACYRRTYEGEPAIKLEALAEQGKEFKTSFKPQIRKTNGLYELKTSEILYFLLEQIKTQKKQNIAHMGQKILVDGLVELAITLANETGINTFALSGGVFVNDYITSKVSNSLQSRGYKIYRNQLVPPGDGGTALGQAFIALNSVT